MELLVKDFASVLGKNYPIAIHYAVIKTLKERYPFGYTLFGRLYFDKNASEIMGFLQGFKDYIQKFEESKEINDPVAIFKDLTVYKQAHTVACAIYFGVEKLPIIYKERGEAPCFDENWLDSKGYTPWSKNELLKINQELEAKLNP